MRGCVRASQHGCVDTCVFPCVRGRACVRAHKCGGASVSLGARMRARERASMCACILACVRACVHACLRMSECECMRAIVRWCGRA